jgi:hypothetical protein
MVLEKDKASAPAEYGKAIFGYSRYSVYNPAIQSQLYRDKNYRSLTRRIANWNVTRDSSTGWRTPTFTDSTIYGQLVEQSGRISAFLSGTAFDQDAVLKTLDGVGILDQVKDGDKYYEVGAIEGHTDGKKAESFAYRIVHLRLLEQYREV